jgi:hypothetical protein
MSAPLPKKHQGSGQDEQHSTQDAGHPAIQLDLGQLGTPPQPLLSLLQGNPQLSAPAPGTARQDTRKLCPDAAEEGPAEESSKGTRAARTRQHRQPEDQPTFQEALPGSQEEGQQALNVLPETGLKQA